MYIYMHVYTCTYVYSHIHMYTCLQCSFVESRSKKGGFFNAFFGPFVYLFCLHKIVSVDQPYRVITAKSRDPQKYTQTDIAAGWEA